MFFWEEEGVAFDGGVDVEDADEVVVFVDFERVEFSADDAAEEALGFLLFKLLLDFVGQFGHGKGMDAGFINVRRRK